MFIQCVVLYILSPPSLHLLNFVEDQDRTYRYKNGLTEDKVVRLISGQQSVKYREEQVLLFIHELREGTEHQRHMKGGPPKPFQDLFQTSPVLICCFPEQGYFFQHSYLQTLEFPSVPMIDWWNSWLIVVHLFLIISSLGNVYEDKWGNLYHKVLNSLEEKC